MVKAFVLLGATGDNAYRPAGVWTGLYEAWTSGLFSTHPTDLHVQINQGHTDQEIYGKLMDVLKPFFEEIKAAPAWSCQAAGGDCTPETFWGLATTNIWEGEGRYNSAGQAANMSYLADYEEVISFMSIPPRAYEEWTTAAVKYWGGGDKNRIAVEKPFGGGPDSLKDATDLHARIIDAGLPKSNLHLTDHWLSFFMNANLPTFRPILEEALGISWSSQNIGKIVVTEYETRGFGGRGAFIDGLGQVRDMVQSHLLQVLALAVVDPDMVNAGLIDDAKNAFFESLSLNHCELGQFDGLLRSKYLKYHADFADSTFCRVFLTSNLPQWTGTELVIQTGKSMDINLYTVEVFEKDGPGVITYNIGAEEVGLADIYVKDWKWAVHGGGGPYRIPLPADTRGRMVSPELDSVGNGYIVKYDDPSLYFPKPYSKIMNALITSNYGSAFATFAQCQKGWEILTADSPSQCLDPAPEDVFVYLPAFLCDQTPPALCDQHKTVKDLYDVDYSCSPKHDQWYGNVDFYKRKCQQALV